MYPNKPRNSSRNLLPINQPIMQPQNVVYSSNTNNVNTINSQNDNILTAVKKPIQQHVYTTQANNNVYAQNVTPFVTGQPQQYTQQQNNINNIVSMSSNQINQTNQPHLIQNTTNILPVTNTITSHVNNNTISSNLNNNNNNATIHRNYHISNQLIPSTNTNLSNLSSNSKLTNNLGVSNVSNKVSNTSNIPSLHQITQIPSNTAMTYYIQNHHQRGITPPTIVNFPHINGNMNGNIGANINMNMNNNINNNMNNNMLPQHQVNTTKIIQTHMPHPQIIPLTLTQT
jgi:hypothetical protein